MSDSVKIIPLGGLGEIGLNMMAVELQGSLLIIDAGMMFPEDYMLGVDFVIPDIDYIRQNKSRVAGIILTHAHEDHIGGLPYLIKEVNAPVYGTPFTLGVLQNKLEELHLSSLVTLHELYPDKILHLKNFIIEFIRVGHSVVDGVGLAIKTPWGLLVHTGDFKISYTSIDGTTTDISKFAQLGDEGVLALMSDSTNAEKTGYAISDREIGETLEKIIMGSSGRVIVALFASNIARIQQLVDISHKYDRKIIINGRSIETTVKLARDLGFLILPPHLELDIDLVDNFPEDKIIIITTGSQGEPMSALARMSSGMHKQIKIKSKDTVILSSTFIPGNEKAISKIINNLYRRGAEVIYEKISDIHTSGHAFQEELKLMIRLTRPKYFIPIHGEYRHLVHHAKIAQQTGIPKDRIILAENGQIIEFDESGGRITGSVATGRVLVDGKGVGDVGRNILKERRALSEDGFVAVTLAFDEETGTIIYGPEIVSQGFVFETETGYLLQDAICVVLEIVEDIGHGTPKRIEKITSRLQTSLRKYFDFTIKRHPVILPFIIEV